MKNEVKIYDPALCCPTGLCGVNIDPELMRIAVVIESLKKKGILVERFNLRDNPQVYVDTKVVNDFIQKESIDNFPITTLNGVIVLTKSYPSNKQISEWLEVSESDLIVTK
ncbi:MULTISPECIES: arsenite efflux transporter metallochaperone ArsD [Myroides]|uniref:Transcriptional regulator n=1 Tax=Myroides odoratimimus TaxID=76832 RepID=A0AAI8C5W8_9FLAO|nr:MULTISPECIES: arsenite efflux transporter metallochaperone ArsD [Myroides]ALU26572.1 transcriptional regulator [Myroides odoratimimus]APA90712.1 transcriptional regulator [Myroides sp. ZB35]MCC9043872.1 arsenite efflux transporter metallochaperone ArsD [Myroides oncorhynchi]MDM1036947.1 arsenite efflux transporter metallochaperone ArsD [Myroides odoratimimus]MDM1051979.1 arsenite efflux transporter metallochaperone ArsD [Myroides odoratimimus]